MSPKRSSPSARQRSPAAEWVPTEVGKKSPVVAAEPEDEPVAELDADTGELSPVGAPDGKESPGRSKRASRPRSRRAGKAPGPDRKANGGRRTAKAKRTATTRQTAKLEEVLTQRIAAIEDRLEVAEAEVGQRIESSTAEVERRLESKLSELEKRVRQVAERAKKGSKSPPSAADGAPAAKRSASSIEAKIKRLSARVKDVDARVEQLPKIADEVETRLEMRWQEAEERVARAVRATERNVLEVRTLADAQVAAARRNRAGAGKSGSKRAPKSRAGKLDLNTITFEELREFGLSTTQSARLIAARAIRGEFESLSELDEVEGFPADLLADLKKRVKV